MEKWVMSVVGIVALSVLLDIILPSGDMNKYIKGVFAVLTVTVIVEPIPRLLASIKNGDIDVVLPSYSEIEVDEQYIEETNDSIREGLEKRITSALIADGAMNVTVTISDSRRIDKRIDSIKITLDEGYGEYKVRNILRQMIHCKIGEVIVVERSG